MNSDNTPLKKHLKKQRFKTPAACQIMENMVQREEDCIRDNVRKSARLSRVCLSQQTSCRGRASMELLHYRKKVSNDSLWRGWNPPTSAAGGLQSNSNRTENGFQQWIQCKQSVMFKDSLRTQCERRLFWLVMWIINIHIWKIRLKIVLALMTEATDVMRGKCSCSFSC